MRSESWKETELLALNGDGPSEPAASTSQGIRSVWLVLSFLLAVTSLTYIRGLDNCFVAEDFDHLAFQMPGASWKGFLSFQFRPLMLILTGAVYKLFGPTPIPYHLLSLFFHGLNVLLVYASVRLLTGGTGRSIVAAMLFALYPRHHEPVLWLGASQYLYTTSFFLASFIGFLLFHKRSRRLWLFLSVAAFGVALLGHEMASVLPLVLIGVEVFILKGESRDWPRLESFSKYAFYGGCLLIYLLARAWMKGQQDIGTANVIEGYGATGIGISQIRTFGSYLAYLAVPQIRLRSLDVGPATIFLVGMVVAGFLIATFRSKLGRFWVLWILVTLSPFVLFVPFGNADRYFYLPAVGLTGLVAGGAEQAYARLGQARKVGARASLALLLILYVLSSVFIIQQQLEDWEEAGRMAQNLIEQVKGFYPRLEPGSRVYAADLPGRRGYAYVFLGGGFQGAVRLAYDDPSLIAFTTRDPVAISKIKSSPSDTAPLVPGVYLFVYDHSEQRMVDYTRRAGALEDLRNSPVWYSVNW